MMASFLYASRRGREEVREEEVNIEVQDVHPVLTQLLHGVHDHSYVSQLSQIYLEHLCSCP